MILAGNVKMDKKELGDIAKSIVVMQRSRFLGKIAYRQTQAIDGKIDQTIERILGVGQNE